MNGEERNLSTVVTIKGLHDTIEANYVFTLYGHGQCDIHYTFSNIPRLQINRNLDKNVAPHMMEFGISFEISTLFDELSWKRKGYWTWYPEGHLGTLEGQVSIYSDLKPQYRKCPDQPWEMDVHDYFYQGVTVPSGRLMPNIVKSAKMNIINYRLTDRKSNVSLTVQAKADLSCRLTQASDMKCYLQILDTLDYVLRWGNYSAGYEVKPIHHGNVRMMMRAGN